MRARTRARGCDRDSVASHRIGSRPSQTTLSACPSAQSGGNLGQITRGQTVPEFEAALGRMRAG